MEHPKLHMPALMLVTKELQESPAGGRELLCKLNHDALKDIFGRRLVVFELAGKRLRGWTSMVNAFRGDIDGLNDAVIHRALQTIRKETVGAIFVDGSNLGGLVKIVKRELPHVDVTTFFHNVEARFFLGSLRQTKSVRALAVLIANYLAERKAVSHSDKIICLSARDSRLLKKLYGRAATHVSPIALEDKLPFDHEPAPRPPEQQFALFVGGSFYANRAGISWFVHHVVPHIQMKTCIVGRGLEDLKGTLESEGKVEVVGAVDSLAEWYLNARFVIAPIFDGSGMKTKVAEALMFGKAVLGTSEAFAGYEEIIGKAGQVCDTADEFVAAIEQGVWERAGHDPALRELFLQRYSRSAMCSRYRSLFGL